MLGASEQPPAASGEAAAAAVASLPCLNSHNCTEANPKEFGKVVVPASARRTAFALTINIAALVERHGIERIGFLTLTFSDHVLSPKEAQRRYHSLRTHVLNERYLGVIRVYERQKSGRIHYHLLVVTHEDIRTGCDFEAINRSDYRSAPEPLRSEWAFWRRTSKAFGFGRTELLPVKSNTEAISRYVGKYISKHIGSREERDKGVRLVEYSSKVRIANTRFAWVSPGAADWRRKLGGFISMMHDCRKIPFPNEAGMRVTFGSRWAYQWRESIAVFPA
jgi:hypothetical protein